MPECPGCCSRRLLGPCGKHASSPKQVALPASEPHANAWNAPLIMKPKALLLDDVGSADTLTLTKDIVVETTLTNLKRSDIYLQSLCRSSHHCLAAETKLPKSHQQQRAANNDSSLGQSDTARNQ